MTRMFRLKDEAAWDAFNRERNTRFGNAAGKINTRDMSEVGNLPSKQLTAGSTPASRSKFGNQKTDGYASKKEAKRAAVLRVRELAGEIRNLREGVKYLLIPRFLNEDGTVHERAVTWKADFVYEEAPSWALVVEDAKGYPNDRWPLKRKLMLMVHGIRVRTT